MAEQPTMSPEEAHAYLTREIFVPVFFQKLAEEYGVRPTSEADATRLLGMSAKMAEARERDLVKQAETHNGFLADADAGLDRVLGAYGYAPVQSAEEDQIKEAAAQLAAVPDVQLAVAVFHQAMERELRAA